MDSYETLNSKKKSVQAFDRQKKYGSLTRLGNDSCTLVQDNKESQKPMKYYTRNFFEKGMEDRVGVNVHAGFGAPPCSIDESASFRIGRMTKSNLPRDNYSLPHSTSASYVSGQGSIKSEQVIRSSNQRTTKSCQPRDDEFYNRHFSIFDHLPMVPNKCVENVVLKDRQGVDTRYMRSNRSKCNFK